LAHFLDYFHLDPRSLYKFSSFSRLKVRADLMDDFVEPLEETITKALARLAVIDSRRWIAFLLDLLPKLDDIDFDALPDIEKRMLLSLKLIRDGQTILNDICLNDAVVTHGDIMRVIPLTLYCDGMEVKSFRGDGIIASTPTGSTAYSLSAGGPIVDPQSDSILLTPLSAHALYAKSFVFSDQRTVDIQVGELENRSAYLSSDGFDAHRLHTGDIVRLSRSEHSVSLVKLKNEGFFSLLYRKL